MKEKIVCEAIQSLRQEGLKFSVDTLAERLKISKKTIYKFFPNKETLAFALYETFYTKASNCIQKWNSSGQHPSYTELLQLYFNSYTITRSEIFNKFQLNNTIYSYAAEKHATLWNTIFSFFEDFTAEETITLKVIIDGAFEMACRLRIEPEHIIKRLVKLL